MQKKLTITVDPDVHAALHSIVGRHRISRFLNDLARAHMAGPALTAGYTAMAADEEREAEAVAWAEDLIGEVADQPRHAD